MEKINYSQIYTKLTKSLSPKVKGIFERRFGVKTGEPETLESIGKSMKITRERVRQIEEVGFNHVRKNHQETLNKVFDEFDNYFDKNGGFKAEETILTELGGSKNRPYILFFLTINDNYNRVCGKKDYDYFWAKNIDSANKAKEVLTSLVKDIKSHGKLLTGNEIHVNFASNNNLNETSLASYLQISKRIQQNKDGKYGLVDWPEIKPRGVRDKAFLVFQKHQKPLHFRQITGLIDELDYNAVGKKTHPQTVHNELIKDARFVLVGRGTYALKEWGYEPGTIKDVITNILKQKQEPINQEDIVKEVLSQRFVAKNTVLINLNNKKHFQKNPEGKYFLEETQTA
ncbi:MAG: hypothetical protein A3D35_02170 [Candidatus Staskawiczbacteria bacterium RIFCSPHIGHO2_02_FULL_34_9]|uniref:HTH HARE-type domain-containing protein n=1 Tax=Candidatus Staskawiczbacteria bacterium RIFCSPHIGHO2_02_FULL_34_9 TaxID=1802206 RepID=A0A1G2HZ46_9BACT|nr:MAG: hypothetical protein A3D35_02170 [Candidatus Staskawiczbacteria bacterium RIFCSPHIGHO2_02_FULL_34_9]